MRFLNSSVAAPCALTAWPPGVMPAAGSGFAAASGGCAWPAGPAAARGSELPPGCTRVSAPWQSAIDAESNFVMAV